VQILRPTKSGGTRRYQDEVAAGFDFIRENEVDGDLDTVYTEFNGGIDNDNILVARPGPKIIYEKLDLTGKLQGSDFDPTPGTPLPPGVFGPGGIPAGSYAPLSIDTGDLAIDATTRFTHQVGTGLSLPHVLTTADEIVVSTITTAPASRGGLIWMIGMFSGYFGAPGAEAGVIGRLRIGGTAGPDGTQIAVSQVIGQGTGGGVFPFQVSCISLPRGAAGGSGPIKLTAQLSAVGGAWLGTVASIRDAQLIAFELA
jgi:hypothetical protein